MLSLYYHQMNQQMNLVQWRRVCIIQKGVAVLTSWHLASTAKVNALLTCIPKCKYKRHSSLIYPNIFLRLYSTR